MNKAVQFMFQGVAKLSNQKSVPQKQCIVEIFQFLLLRKRRMGFIVFQDFSGNFRGFFLGIKMYVDGFSQTTARRGSGVACKRFF